MTVSVANTNLTDDFNSWRLRTNLLATSMSNNAVTVYRAGSSARGKSATGNTHIKGTLSSVELRTDTIKGGNAAMGTAGKSGAITIASNTSVTGTSLSVAANTTFTGNVIFNTAGTDRVNLGNISRVIVAGGAVGQFLRISTVGDNPEFKALTLRDITDLSSNSADIILSGANSTFSAGAKNSPALILAGGSNSGADRFKIYAADNTTAGDDDLVINLVDNTGDSKLNINNLANTVMATIDSRGSIVANVVTATSVVTSDLDLNGAADISGNATIHGATVLNGAVTLGDASTDTITFKGNVANAVFTGVAAFNGNVTVGNANTDTLTVNANTTFNSGVNISSGSAVSAPTGTFTSLVATGSAALNGTTQLGDASTDIITTRGNFANASFNGNLMLNGSADLLVDGTLVISENGKLHANNAITNGSIKGVMLENSGVSAATYGSSTTFPIVTVDAQGLVTAVTTGTLNDATTSAKGIASFNSSTFSVSSGAVSLLSTITSAHTFDNDITFGAANSSVVVWDKSDTALEFADAAKATFGTGADLQIYHDGSSSYVSDAGTGSLYLRGTNIIMDSAAGEKYIDLVADGAVTLYHNNVAKIATTSGGINVTGTVTDDGATHDGDVTFTGAATNIVWDKSDNALEFADNTKATFGAGDDLQIYHDASHSYITDSGTGNLKITASQLDILGSGETMATFVDDGAVTLYHDNSAKFATSATGATITGTLVADNITVNSTLSGAIEADTIIPAVSAANSTHYLGFFNATTGAQGILTDTGISYNPSTNVLTAGTFSTGASLAVLSGAGNMAYQVTSTDAIASMEIGGVTGAFIDLKMPSGDDYDLRLNAGATGGGITIASGTFSILGSGETMATFVDDGAVTLYHNNVARIATTSSGVSVTGDVDLTGNVDMADNATIRVGNDDDLLIYHNNGDHSYIRNVGEGDLRIGGSDKVIIGDDGLNEYHFEATANGSVKLFHNGVAKLETSATGVTVSGTLTATTISGAIQSLPTGTKMLFHQTAAPTGWTKDTSHNDKALRVVSGSISNGGSVAFETAFASHTPAGSVSATTNTSVAGATGAHTLTLTQTPAHTHALTGVVGSADYGTNISGISSAGDGTSNSTLTTTSQGGGQSHSHSLTINSATSSTNASFSGTAINLDVAYVDMIIASKN